MSAGFLLQLESSDAEGRLHALLFLVLHQGLSILRFLVLGWGSGTSLPRVPRNACT